MGKKGALTPGKKTPEKGGPMHRSRTIQADLRPKLRERYARRPRAGKTRMLDALGEDDGSERK